MKRRTLLSGAALGAAALTLAAPAVAQNKRVLKLVGTFPRGFPGLGHAAERDCCINWPSPFLYRNPLISCGQTKQLVNECNLPSYA